MKTLKIIRKNIDLKLTLILAGFYTCFDIVHIFKILYMNRILGAGNDIIWMDYLLDWIIVVSFMQLIAISTKHLINKKISWLKIFTLHIILSIFIGVFIRIVSDLYFLLVYTNVEYDIQFSINRFISFLDLNFLIYFAMVSMIYSFYYLKQVKKAEKQKALLKSQLVDTRIRMLTSQLQPHFLFNTLNCISSLIDFDQEKAQNTLVDLSEFYREVLHNSDATFVTVEKELEILTHYLNILEVRFSDDLSIEKRIDSNLLHEKIPALILQPLIENSVNHGYSFNHPELVVTIEIYSEGKYLFLRVVNSGVSLQDSLEPMSQGKGLSNIRERLKSIFGSDFLFLIRNKRDHSGVENLIKIPMESKGHLTKKENYTAVKNPF